MNKVATPKESRWLARVRWLLVWVIPPRNLLCWITALYLWAFRGLLGLNQPKDVFRRLLLAPAELPQRAVNRLWRWRRGATGSEDQRIATSAVIVLSTELYNKGFLVREARITDDDYVRLRTMVPEDRVSDYGHIVASVYRQFPELTLDRLVERTEPLDALDASWGSVHGMPDHARLAYTAPCYVCQQNQEIGFVFGLGAVNRTYDASLKQSRMYVSQTGQRYVVKGHYCEKCRQAAGLILVVGISTTDHEPDTSNDEQNN